MSASHLLMISSGERSSVEAKRWMRPMIAGAADLLDREQVPPGGLAALVEVELEAVGPGRGKATEGRGDRGHAGRYARLRQVRWVPQMVATGNLGGHVGPDSPVFLKNYVLPLLRTTVLDDISHIIVRYISRVVDTPSFVLFKGQEAGLQVWAKSKPYVSLDDHEITVAEWSYTHGEMAAAKRERILNGIAQQHDHHQVKQVQPAHVALAKNPDSHDESQENDNRPHGNGSEQQGLREFHRVMGRESRAAGGESGARLRSSARC